MRVLVVDLESAWRGGQAQALLLLTGLRARGHDAALLAVRDAALAQRARAAGIPVHLASGTMRRAGAARLLRRLLGEQRFDIVHANEAHALTSAWLAGAHRRSTLVAARRVAFPLGTNPLARARYRAARRIIAVSHFVAQSVMDSGVPADTVRVVHDGVALPPPVSLEARRSAREHWGVGEGQFLIGCVGYLLPEKGQEFLVRALPAIRKHFATCHLLLAGDGPCRARLEQIAAELGISTAVRFAGHVENVAEVYAALDIFAFPSLAEPMGSSLLAAMAAGLPVIGVATGGVPEAVAKGGGLLLPDPTALGIAKAAVLLLSDPVLSANLGQAGRRIIEQKFSADRMVEETLHVFAGVAETPPAAG